MAPIFKKEINYFDQFVVGVGFCKHAAEQLLATLNDERLNNEERESIHRIEQEADKHVHMMFNELNHSFITPIDRDDIIEIVKETDNVTDGIDGVAEEFYMLHIDHLLPAAKVLAELIVKSCSSMADMMIELKQFKKSNNVMKHIIAINDIEEEGDRVYREAVYELYNPGQDPAMASKWRLIFNLMENVLDTCENVADTVQSIMTKNQ